VTSSVEESGTSTGAISNCDPVVLPDPEVEEAVRAALEIPAGPISAEAMDSLTELEVQKVDTLDGIECAVLHRPVPPALHSGHPRLPQVLMGRPPAGW
jgi:hypothetical protein